MAWASEARHGTGDECVCVSLMVVPAVFMCSARERVASSSSSEEHKSGAKRGKGTAIRAGASGAGAGREKRRGARDKWPRRAAPTHSNMWAECPRARPRPRNMRETRRDETRRDASTQSPRLAGGPPARRAAPCLVASPRLAYCLLCAELSCAASCRLESSFVPFRSVRPLHDVGAWMGDARRAKAKCTRMRMWMATAPPFAFTFAPVRIAFALVLILTPSHAVSLSRRLWALRHTECSAQVKRQVTPTLTNANANANAMPIASPLLSSLINDYWLRIAFAFSSLLWALPLTADITWPSSCAYRSHVVLVSTQQRSALHIPNERLQSLTTMNRPTLR